jgi:hypothetical protein
MPEAAVLKNEEVLTSANKKALLKAIKLKNIRPRK